MITALLLEVAYCLFQLVVVLRPEGAGPWPLFGDSVRVPLELLVARRLYAIEGWLAFIGLVLYLGLTEIGPRRSDWSA